MSTNAASGITSGGAALVTSGPGFVGKSPGVNGMINVEVHDTTSVSDAPRRYMRLQVTR